MRSAPSRAGRGAQDAGFSLIEAILAMTLFMLMVAAFVPFVIQVHQAQSGMTPKLTAIALADKQLEYIRSVAPAQLVKGRYSGDVAALVSSPGLVNLSDDVTSSGNSDPSASSGSANAAVPLTSTQTIGSVTYTVRVLVDECYVASGASLCSASSSTGASIAYRASIDVSWPQTPGVVCVTARAGMCEYVLTGLIDPSPDPIFQLYGTPSITAVKDVTTSPTTTLGVVHPSQVLTLQLIGSNFAPGATTQSPLGDQTAPVSANTGSAITVQYRASTTLGARALKVINPNGTTGSTTVTVATSTPGITAMTPASAPRNALTTFTLTGSDFFSGSSPAAQPINATVTMNGSATVPPSSTLTVAPTVSNVTVVSKTQITFQATLPSASSGYVAHGTVTLTNPDSATATYSFTVSAT